jgi:hypothetical protein
MDSIKQIPPLQLNEVGPTSDVITTLLQRISKFTQNVEVPTSIAKLQVLNDKLIPPLGSGIDASPPSTKRNESHFFVTKSNVVRSRGVAFPDKCIIRVNETEPNSRLS